MKILLAGGGGYIGSPLANKLHAEGHDVHVVDLFWFGNHLDEGISFEERNIRHLEESELEPYECVVFLGGLSNDPMAEFDPYLNFVYNASLPVYLAYMAKRVGVPKYVFASTCSVYGSVDPNEVLNEQSKIAPEFPYGISKLQAETALLNMASDSFSVVALRKGTIGGYSPRVRYDLVLNAMFKSAVINKQIQVHNPEIWRPILSVKDAVGSYCSAIFNDVGSDVFNIHYDNYTLLEIAQEIQSFFGSKGQEITIETSKNADPRSYRLDNTRCKEVLGYQPVVGIQDVMQELFDNCIDRNCDYDNDAYYNIRTFRKLKNNDTLV